MLNKCHNEKVDLVSSANVRLLEGLIETISPLTNAQFTWKPTSELSSTGKHIRHIIDHYQCFFKGNDVINYDDRSRATIVERQVRLAQTEIRNVIGQLKEITFTRSSSMYVLISATPGETPSPVRSSLVRELLFLQSHTIHHMAVIQMMLNTLEIPVDKDFSLAPSTRTYNLQHKNQVSV